jgi:hypothetical protein
VVFPPPFFSLEIGTGKILLLLSFFFRWSCVANFFNFFFFQSASKSVSSVFLSDRHCQRQTALVFFYLSHWDSSSHFLLQVIMHVTRLRLTIQTILSCCCSPFFLLFHPCYSIQLLSKFFISFCFHVHLLLICFDDPRTSHAHGWFLVCVFYDIMFFLY